MCWHYSLRLTLRMRCLDIFDKLKDIFARNGPSYNTRTVASILFIHGPTLFPYSYLDSFYLK